MFGIDRRLLQNFDWMLLLLVIAIVGVGIINLASATHVDDALTGEVRRQLFSLGVGGIAMVSVLAIDYRHYERFATPALLICIALLAATLVFAPVTRGSQSWLFGGRFQPSELAKLAVILFLAFYLDKHAERLHEWRTLLGGGVILGAFCLLVLGGKDLGGVIMLGLIAAVILWVAGTGPGRCGWAST